MLFTLSIYFFYFFPHKKTATLRISPAAEKNAQNIYAKNNGRKKRFSRPLSYLLYLPYIAFTAASAVYSPCKPPRFLMSCTKIFAVVSASSNARW